jgi:predicted transcriptional regulator
MADEHSDALLDMTVGIVANYVSHNQIRPDDLASLIASTHDALSGAGTSGEPHSEPLAKPSAAQVRKSVSETGLISFIDSRTYQSLKRHLGANGFSPESYRETFGLRPDYPMVSPAYAARRSALAKASGLGQGGRKPKAPANVAPKTRKSKV